MSEKSNGQRAFEAYHEAAKKQSVDVGELDAGVEAFPSGLLEKAVHGTMDTCTWSDDHKAVEVRLHGELHVLHLDASGGLAPLPYLCTDEEQEAFKIAEDFLRNVRHAELNAPTDFGEDPAIDHPPHYGGADEAKGGVTYDGKPIPPWSEVGPEVRAAWEAAAAVVVQASRHTNPVEALARAKAVVRETVATSRGVGAVDLAPEDAALVALQACLLHEQLRRADVAATGAHTCEHCAAFASGRLDVQHENESPDT